MEVNQACVLAIGGLDPSGGAGLLADARAIHHAGAFACGVATLLTVQSTSGLAKVQALPAPFVKAQAGEILAHQDVRAFKVGALGSRANVRVVARLLKGAKIPSVVDTPMLPTRGASSLLDRNAVETLRAELLPLATLVTLNRAEAETLLGTRTRSPHLAAARISALGVRALIVKGGHFSGAFAEDALCIAGDVILLRAKRVRGLRVHGAGCTFASILAGLLAQCRHPVQDGDLVFAAQEAKKMHHALLQTAVAVGGALRVLAPKAAKMSRRSIPRSAPQGREL